VNAARSDMTWEGYKIAPSTIRVVAILKPIAVARIIHGR
jgi:hypothetical protein